MSRPGDSRGRLRVPSGRQWEARPAVAQSTPIILRCLILEVAAAAVAFHPPVTMQWEARRSEGPVGRHAALIAAAVLGGTFAWWLVAALPPMHVRVGGDATAELVPTAYQVSVFPAFAAFAVALAIDLFGRRERQTWVARAALLLVTGGLAIARIAGWVPLSGHGLFLAAALAYEVTRPAAPDANVLAALVVPGLLVTGWYKLVVWGDPWWFLASLVAGAALGSMAARRARA